MLMSGSGARGCQQLAANVGSDTHARSVHCALKTIV